MLRAKRLSRAVEVERRFVPGPFGQIHVRIARPTAATASKRPLFLFPPTPHSSDYFVPFMAEMATDRNVVAVDTPGYGDSERPEKLSSIADYAASALAAIEALDFGGTERSVDVLGYHTGGLIAVELAAMQEQSVRHLVLPGFPFFLAKAREAAYRRFAKADTIELDGSHLSDKWEYSKIPMGAGVSLERVQEHFNDHMKSYPHSWRAFRAVFTYPTEERTSRVTQPVLLISVNGSLKTETKAAVPYFRNASYLHLDDYSFGIFDLGANVVADKSRSFLDV